MIMRRGLVVLLVTAAAALSTMLMDTNEMRVGYSKTVNAAIEAWKKKEAIWTNQFKIWSGLETVRVAKLGERSVAYQVYQGALKDYYTSVRKHEEAVEFHRAHLGPSPALKAEMTGLVHVMDVIKKRLVALIHRHPTFHELSVAYHNAHHTNNQAWFQMATLKERYSRKRAAYESHCNRKRESFDSLWQAAQNSETGRERAAALEQRRAVRRAEDAEYRDKELAHESSITADKRLNHWGKIVNQNQLTFVGVDDIMLPSIHPDPLLARLAPRNSGARALGGTSSQVLLQDSAEDGATSLEAADAERARTQKQIEADERREAIQAAKREKMRLHLEALRRAREYEENCGVEATEALTKLGEAAVANTYAYEDAHRRSKRAYRKYHEKLARYYHFRRLHHEEHLKYLNAESRIERDPNNLAEQAAFAAREVAYKERVAAWHHQHRMRDAFWESDRVYWAAFNVEAAARVIRDEDRREADEAKRYMETLIEHFEKAEVFDALQHNSAWDGAMSEERHFDPFGGTVHLSDIAAAAWNEIFGVPFEEGKRDMLAYDEIDEMWIPMPNSGSGTLHSAVSCEGVPYRLDSRGDILRLEGKENWVKIGGSSASLLRFKWFAVGDRDLVHAVGFEPPHKVYTYDPSKGTGFQERAAAPTGGVMIASMCGEGGEWLVTAAKELFHMEDSRADYWKIKGKNVLAVGVGQDVFAIGADGRLYEYVPATAEDVARDNHWFRWKVQGLVRVASAHDGTVLATNVKGDVLKHILHHDTLSLSEQDHLELKRGGVWEGLAGGEAIAHLVLGPEGAVYATTAEPWSLLKRKVDGSGFSPVPDADYQDASIGCDRSFFAINGNNNLVQWNDTDKRFVLRSDRNLTQIASCGKGIVYGVDTAGKLLEFNMLTETYQITSDKMMGQIFPSAQNPKPTQVAPPLIAQVACNCQGAVFAVAKDQTLWGRVNGEEYSKGAIKPWVKYGQGVKNIAVADEIYLVDKNDDLYRFYLLPRVGAYGKDQRWQSLHKKLREVSLSPDGRLGGINEEGQAEVFVRTNPSSRVPSWVRVKGTASAIAVQDASHVFILSMGVLRQRNFVTGEWEVPFNAEGMLFESISVACDGTMMGVLESGKKTSAAAAAAIAKPVVQAELEEEMDLLLGEGRTATFDFSTGITTTAEQPLLSVEEMQKRAEAEAKNNDIRSQGRVVRLHVDPSGAYSWEQVSDSEDIAQVIVGDRENIYGITREGLLLKRGRAHTGDGVTTEDAWLELSGISTGVPKVKQAAAGCHTGELWAVDFGKRAFKFDPSSGTWEQTAEGVNQIAIGYEDVYALADDNRVYRYFPKSLEGKWVDLYGSAVFTLAAGAEGAVWATDRFNRIIAVSAGVHVQKDGDDIQE